MELIIGRESMTPQSIGGRLHVVTSGKKDYFIGVEGSVPKTVSHQHCKIVFNPDGSMLLISLKPTNITFINGIEVVQKSITRTDRIELGSGRYVVDLEAVLDAVDSEIPKIYDISHLKAIWDNYKAELKNLDREKEKMGLIQSIPSLFSAAAMICAFIDSLAQFRIVLIVIFFCGMLFLILYRKRHIGYFTTKREELDEQFHRDYVCPNPNCRRFLGPVPYEDLIKQTKSCFVCKAVYEVKE